MKSAVHVKEVLLDLRSKPVPLQITQTSLSDILMDMMRDEKVTKRFWSPASFGSGRTSPADLRRADVIAEFAPDSAGGAILGQRNMPVMN